MILGFTVLKIEVIGPLLGSARQPVAGRIFGQRLAECVEYPADRQLVQAVGMAQWADSLMTRTAFELLPEDRGPRAKGRVDTRTGRTIERDDKRTNGGCYMHQPRVVADYTGSGAEKIYSVFEAGMARQII